MNLFFQMNSVGLRPLIIMQIRKKIVKKLIYYIECPRCNKKMESEFEDQLKYNYKTHLKYCSKSTKLKEVKKNG